MVSLAVNDAFHAMLGIQKKLLLLLCTDDIEICMQHILKLNICSLMASERIKVDGR